MKHGNSQVNNRMSLCGIHDLLLQENSQTRLAVAPKHACPSGVRKLNTRHVPPSKLQPTQTVVTLDFSRPSRKKLVSANGLKMGPTLLNATPITAFLEYRVIWALPTLLTVPVWETVKACPSILSGGQQVRSWNFPGVSFFSTSAKLLCPNAGS